MTEKHYFDEKLSRRAKAEEDLWFARRDQKLIEAARRRQTRDSREDTGDGENPGQSSRSSFLPGSHSPKEIHHERI